MELTIFELISNLPEVTFVLFLKLTLTIGVLIFVLLTLPIGALV